MVINPNAGKAFNYLRSLLRNKSNGQDRIDLNNIIYFDIENLYRVGLLT